MDAGLFREDGQVWGWWLSFDRPVPTWVAWHRPSAFRDMDLLSYLCSVHLRDSDSWLWCRILGLEINVPRG